MAGHEEERPHKKARVGDSATKSWLNLALCEPVERRDCSAAFAYTSCSDTATTLSIDGLRLHANRPLYPKTCDVVMQDYEEHGTGAALLPFVVGRDRVISASTVPVEWTTSAQPWMMTVCEQHDQVSAPDEAEPLINGEPIFAFGALANISATIETPMQTSDYQQFKVALRSGTAFSAVEGQEIYGRVTDSKYSRMIEALLNDAELQLHTSCYLEQQPRGMRKTAIQACKIEVCIYGPLDMCEEVGSWAEEHEAYLQDPKQCHVRWARYCNPHRLSATDPSECPWLFDFLLSSCAVRTEPHERPDLLDVLSTRQNLEEATQPAAVKTELKRHQKQALTFVLQRERGWNFRSGGQDIWDIVDSGPVPVFLNRVANAAQEAEPEQFRGGIIADTMGLGKTLTMIALVTTDLGKDMIHAGYCPEDTDSTKPFAPATLIVVLPSLLSTWEEQIALHLETGSVNVHRHHGKSRISESSVLRQGDIVLTTYYTISAEWTPDDISSTHPVFGRYWRRIIVDEAHYIKNSSARMTKAARSIEAMSRWAVTATPIQNRLGDLAALVQFIRAHPYDDPRRFDRDISQLWKDGDSDEAVARLKQLSACLILRRSKGTIDLPSRTDLQYPVDFTNGERDEYERLRLRTINKLDDLLNDRHELGGMTYVNALQRIEALRLFCNLGLHYQNRTITVQQSSDEWQRHAQTTFYRQCEMAAIVCLQCSAPTNLADNLLDDQTRRAPQAIFFSCLRFICTDCVDELKRSRQALPCGHSVSCPVARVTTSTATDEEEYIDTGADMVTTDYTPQISSKVKTLVADLQTVSPTEKCIVFSTWRLSLDMIELALRQGSINSVRFDGKVPQKDRQSIIDRFQTDPNVRVMLLTLSCGAVGLTLTAASRAYLLEPHWNPTLEEQALARIHRLGQDKPVTTVRLYMRNSFEEEVMKLQESKKELASILLSQHDGDQADTSLGVLERLRSLL